MFSIAPGQTPVLSLPSVGKNCIQTIMQLPRAIPSYAKLKMCDRLFCLDTGWYTVAFGYSDHGYSGYSDLVANLAGTESFTIISSLNKSLKVATHFGHTSHVLSY